MGEQRADPFGGPGAVRRAIDMPQGLERDRLAAVIGMTALHAPFAVAWTALRIVCTLGRIAEPQRMMSASHRQHRGARRTAFVEDIDQIGRASCRERVCQYA